jgi:hypothetical protein
VTGAQDGSEQRKGGPLKKKRKKEEKNTGKIRAGRVYLHNFFSPFAYYILWV